MPEPVSSAAEQVALSRLPEHVAIIMDGNGRWAKRRGLLRLAGHKAGTDNLRPVVVACAEYGVKVLTIFAFSTENWGRPDQEVKGLMRLFGRAIRSQSRDLHAEGVRVRHVGRFDGVSKSLQKALLELVDLTKDNTRITLNVAFNYGGRAEILDAVRSLVRDGVDPEAIDEAMFASRLYTAGQPDPDLIIRTAGEMRISNFLIWQGAYAEYYSTPVFWPDFDRVELRKALEAYSQRERRFGKV